MAATGAKGERVASTQFSACRSIGHAWRRTWTLERERGTGIVTLVLHCTACETERRDVYNPRNGELMQRRYDYPKDYRWKAERPGDEAPARQDYRAEWLSDLLHGGAQVIQMPRRKTA